MKKIDLNFHCHRAIGQARELIQLGHADVFLAGGAEALCHFVVAGFNSLRATTATAVRPFDARRDGLALGEGAALVVVESETHARRRRRRTLLGDRHGLTRKCGPNSHTL